MFRNIHSDPGKYNYNFVVIGLILSIRVLYISLPVRLKARELYAKSGTSPTVFSIMWPDSTVHVRVYIHRNPWLSPALQALLLILAA